MAPNMKRFTGLLSRTKSTALRSSSAGDVDFSNAPTDSPEANAPRAIQLFCESGSNSNGGEEVLHLPVIVESAESSPAAAANAALQIRKFLGREFATRPHVQYNAIMLIRILSDNPGATFTRNFDSKFVGAVKELLRNGRDPSTQQILRETLDSLEVEKSADEGLTGLFQMWRKEKGHGASLYAGRGARASYGMGNVAFGNVPPGQGPQYMTGGQGRRSGRTQLPNPSELASRVEEAKNTAKILLQLVQSTPTGEVLDNELIKEFSERCSSASRSMQTYINCNDPAPDHDTMQTLIETNEQLSLAVSRHQRAVLAARRARGAVDPSPNQAAAEAESNGYSAFAPPSQPQQQDGPPQLPPVSSDASNGFGVDQSYQNSNSQVQSSFGGYQAPPGPPPSSMNAAPRRGEDEPLVNPFADPVGSEPTHYGAFAQSQHFQPGQSARTFNIEPEPDFSIPSSTAQRPPPSNHDHNHEHDDAYSDSSGRPSPILSRASVADGSQRGAPSDGIVSPTTPYGTYDGEMSARAGPAGPAPVRPDPDSWHANDVTPSFVGRQAAAANGLVAHGARGPADEQTAAVPEIDGNSQVGRRMRDDGWGQRG